MANVDDGSLTIGVDFDGVLFDQVPHILEGFRRLHGVDLGPVGSWQWNLTEHPAIRQAGLSDDQIWQVFRHLELKEEIHRTEPLDAHARRVLATLIEHGHEVHLVTSRPEHSRPSVELFLEHNGFDLHDINMGVHPKVGWDVLVDDLPHNAEAAAEHGGTALLFDQPYNRAYTCNGNPTRVEDWSHIHALLTGDGPVGDNADNGHPGPPSPSPSS